MALIKENLQDAQAKMNFFVDKKRIEREFAIGDWVYLRLRPYRQMTVAVRGNLKLSLRYYRPFQVIQKIGKVAYKIDLPLDSQIFPIFHVSYLKKKLGAQTTPTHHHPRGYVNPRTKKKKSYSGG